jgi:hypothetical protein
MSLALAHLMSCLEQLPYETLYVGALQCRALHLISPDVPTTLNIAQGYVSLAFYPMMLLHMWDFLAGILPPHGWVIPHVLLQIHCGHMCSGKLYEATCVRQLLQTQSSQRMTLLWHE